MRRFLCLPAVHFVLLGALLFVVVEARRSPSISEDGAPRPRVEVPASHITAAREEMQARLRRALTAEEEAQALVTAVDRELLFRHALELGLDRQPEIQRRLAQIATFVADSTTEPPPEAEPTAWWAAEAKRLGLDRGDRVVRSLLIDRARRLIRAAVLIREPSEEALEDYWREFPGDFMQPPELGIDVVFLGRDTTPARALESLEAVRTQDGASAGARGPKVESWPAVAERELERRLGRPVVEALPALDVGAWHGPLWSRDGACLVRARERRPARPAALAQVRDQVRAKARQQLADRWLEMRLEQLRQHYDVVIGEGAVDESVETVEAAGRLKADRRSS